jgi:hypothetical protein
MNPQRPSGLLEPDAGKLARPVLRGPGRSNAPRLPDLGGACRRDHQLKQHPRWKLEQTRPGYFTWTTPAGRTYTVGPDTHPI